MGNEKKREAVVELYDFDVHGGVAEADRVAWKLRARIGNEVVEGGLSVTIPRGRVELAEAIEKSIESGSLYARMDADAHENAKARDLTENLLHAHLRDATESYERTLDLLRAEDFKHHPVGGIEVVATARMQERDELLAALKRLLAQNEAMGFRHSEAEECARGVIMKAEGQSVRHSESRGVAGDRCEVGNNCGRTGCPECQS